MFGLSLPWIIASAMTIMQTNTPSELMGRVSGADGFVITIAQSIGIAGGAALISVFYYRTLCYFVAGVALLATIYLATRAEQRKGASAGGSAEGGDDDSAIADGSAEPLAANA
jgi:hypothetical protein